MVVEVSYADGREDVFDLERLCEGHGQPLATEYRLRFDRMERDGLWVEANSYGPGEGGASPSAGAAGGSCSPRRRRSAR